MQTEKKEFFSKESVKDNIKISKEELTFHSNVTKFFAETCGGDLPVPAQHLLRLTFNPSTEELQKKLEEEAKINLIEILMDHHNPYENVPKNILNLLDSLIYKKDNIEEFKEKVKEDFEKWLKKKGNYEEVLKAEIPDIGDSYMFKKISITGMVSKSSEIFNEKYKTIYECTSCSNIVSIKENYLPKQCFKCNSKNNFNKIEECFRDFKEIEIEEKLDNLERQPEVIKVRIFGDLLKKNEIKNIQIGQLINLIGIVDKEKIKIKNNKDIYCYYLIASVIEIQEYTTKVTDITSEDLEKIKEISKNNPLDLLSNSLAPNVFGYNSIKKAIVLQSVRGPENLENVRPRIHILLVSDPAQAKSVLAWNTYEKTPKAMFGSGDNMSAAGLTTSTERDEISGRWSFRGGLLCRANKSLIVIDEIEKLKAEDKKGLHTPMEKGIIITTKAGKHQISQADCSILGCCNPRGGSFDTSGYSSVTEQVNLPEAIISRFDLIYYIKDEVNSDKDEKIMNSLFKEKKLNKNTEIDEKILNADLFRKYISYVKELEPVFSEEVKTKMTELYKELREESKNSTENKITARQAGGIIRLAVASAKIRLSEIVEMQDFEIAETLILDALESIGFARKLNSLDQSVIYNKITNKKMNITIQLTNFIKSLINEGKNSEKIIENNVLEKGYELNIFRRTLDNLKKEGTIIGNPLNLKWID